MNVEDEGLGSDDLADGPSTTSERQLHTPVRPAAVKRRSNIHDEEPDTKKFIREEDDENMEGGPGLDLDEVCARREDEAIVCQHFLANNLHDVYSNERRQFAASRQSTELVNRQLPGVDVMEVFCPERAGKPCKEYSLDQRLAMDIKSGYDC